MFFFFFLEVGGISLILGVHQIDFTRMKTYAFEQLDVWQCSRKLSVLIYQKTKLLPVEERYGLVSQMRRAAISVSSSLAEGTSRQSGKEKARYTEMAYGSLMELLCQSIICGDLDFLPDDSLAEIRALVNEIAVKSTRLRQSQLKTTIT